MRPILSVLLAGSLLCITACGDSGDGDDNNNADPANLPTITVEDLEYAGAFRFTNGDFGVSNVNYAIGTLAYNPENHSLFIVGHDHQCAIAEYPIARAGMQETELQAVSTPELAGSAVELVQIGVR